MGNGTQTKTVIITGGLGNLGSKLCRHLLLSDRDINSNSYKVVLLEHPQFLHRQEALHPDATIIPVDLGNMAPSTVELIDNVLQDAFALVHFSAVNPYPNATWSESAQSMDHTFNIFQLAVRNRVRRVIFASSNHVMGGYKDDTNYGPSSVLPSSDPRVGTSPLNPQTLLKSGDGKGYAAAKLAGERLAMTLGNLYGDTTTFVVLRIGWCQPGENLPQTLTAAGSPPEFLSGNDGSEIEQNEGDKRDEVWYKQMWLSNQDFMRYFDKALELTVPTTEPEFETSSSTTAIAGVHRNVRRGFVLLNAMSANAGSKWSLAETEKWLEVVSKDDSLKE